MELEHQPPPIGIDHDVTLAAVDFLAGVIPPRATGFGGFDTLAIDDRCTRAGLAADTQTIQHHQFMVQDFPGSVVAKPGEPTIDRLVRREMLRQHPPGTATAQHKEDRVHQFAHRPGSTPASLGWWRQQWREYLPFRVGQIARVAQLVPVMLCPGLGGPHRRLQVCGERSDSMELANYKPPRDSFETASDITKLLHFLLSCSESWEAIVDH